jgi:hypothetical protein
MAMFFYKNFTLFATGASNKSYLRTERCIHCHRGTVIDGLIIWVSMHQ